MKIKSFLTGASIIVYSLFTISCGNGSNNATNTDSTSSLNTPPPANGREPNAARPTDTGTSSAADTMKKTDTTIHH